MLIVVSLLIAAALALLRALPTPLAQAAAGDPAVQQSLSALIGVAGAPIVAQLVSALVKPFTPDVRFYAPSAIVLGIGWNLLIVAGLAEATGAHQFWIAAAIMGVTTGLAAAGLSSSTRAEVNQDMAARGAVVLPNPPPGTRPPPT